MDFSSSTQNIGWFRDRYREGTLVIKPPYQRKPVWLLKQKCSLIETILLNLPVPEIFVQQIVSSQGDTVYAVVDGQQRIRTVLQFIGLETDPAEQEYVEFALEKLPNSSVWANSRFSDLSDDEKTGFYRYLFAVRLLNTDSNIEVRDMFRRLNEFLTPLNAQELRHAMYSGPFIRLAESLANNDYWIDNRIVTPAHIRRMKDVEFVSELLIGVLHGPQGGSARIINDYYERYEEYETEFPEQRAARKLFDSSLKATQSIFPNIRESRWSNSSDFYTLFVTLGLLLRTRSLPRTRVPGLRRALIQFAGEVDERLADDAAGVSTGAVNYVRAVEKGANDKKRRADRHAALLAVMEPFLTSPR